MQPRDWTALLNALPTSRLLTIPTKAFAAALRFQLGVDGRPDDPNASCVCGHHPLDAAHAISCSSTGATSRIHTRLRDVVRAAANFCGLRPDTNEPRQQPNSNNSRGGADIRITRLRPTGFTVAGVPAVARHQGTVLIVDVTTAAVGAASHRDRADREPARSVVRYVEARKHTQTEDSAVARLNGSQYLPCGMERDTLTLGDGMGQAIKRFASQNQGLEYEGREDLLQGYVEGLWSAPTAERYWRKVIVAQIVIAREEEVARAFGINSPGG